MQITKVIQKKNPLTIEQLKALFDKMVEARNIIAKSQEQLEKQKDIFKDLKEEQSEIIDKCFADYERGFTVSNFECTVTYDGKVANYYDVITGEKIEGIVLEEGEQLEMTGGKFVDAEQLIRESSKED